MGEQRRARLGGDAAASGAGEQALAELRFGPGDPSAQGGPSQVERGRRAAEAAAVEDGDEILEWAQIDSSGAYLV